MSSYHDNKEVRRQIDFVLHKNAILFQNLGIESSKTEKETARLEERKNLREVKHLDPDFIERLLLDSKD